ncbi:Signal transduction response regulator [Parasponia andersonii]|uniref:Signal transduction response regulator n=1 Tax=Parasponia andersonii TaxID=3476 RepID=A0A2P5CPV2_PARAD|nr:Signal transduction response regulator [Parasponia andersonii]
MAVKVATTGLQWPILPHSPSSSQTLASAMSSPSSKRRNRCGGGGGAALLVCRHARRLQRSALFGTPSTRLHRYWSCEAPKLGFRTIRRASSASLDSFSDEEFSKKIQELALRFQLSDDDDDDDSNRVIDSELDPGSLELVSDSREDSNSFSSSVNFVESRNLFPASQLDSVEPPWPGIRHEPPDWTATDEIIPASIERKANSVDLPLSLRIIKRKIQWQDSFREVGESAYCSVKKAFSSMVFIIRELHSYSLQMREFLFYEDLQDILSRVQKEMHASFVWLFQQVFSHTPTLMVYVMILLANFTVYSMGHNAAIAATAASPTGSYSTTATTEAASVVEAHDHSRRHKFDSSAIKSFSVSSGGKTTSIGGNNGGGGKARPVASGTAGDGGFNDSDQFRGVLPDGASQMSSFRTREAGSSVSEQETREEEVALWNSIVDEASKMQALFRDEALDQDTVQKFVSPVNAKIESDNYEDYFRTDLLYQTGLSQEPNNPLLLANYAQFLYLVAHDYDRAEEYFKRATGVEPADAEAYSKYAAFLWRARNDLWAAEETFLEAISADPANSYYAANYAHFLWNTGGEDTCFPLSPPDTTTQES